MSMAAPRGRAQFVRLAVPAGAAGLDPPLFPYVGGVALDRPTGLPHRATATNQAAVSAPHANDWRPDRARRRSGVLRRWPAR